MTSSPIAGSTFFGLDISQLATSLLSIRRRISKRVLLLEFFVLLAEATLPGGCEVGSRQFIPLPSGALDRGVPADPLKMASLLQAFVPRRRFLPIVLRLFFCHRSLLFSVFLICLHI